MQFDAVMHSFVHLTSNFNGMIDGFMLLFSRVLGFLVTGPIFNRKNLPFMIKISATLYITGTLLWMISPEYMIGPKTTHETLIFIPLVLNITIGVLLGFIANLGLEMVSAAGALANSEIGLSAAAMMDPSKGTQTQLMETLYSYIAIILFIDMGGVYWLIHAIKRSLEIFPLMSTNLDLIHKISLNYLVTMTGDVTLIAVELVAPILVVMIAMDVMLGVVNRTAQQIPVFQLSAAIKPAVGLGIIMVTMTTFIEILGHYLRAHCRFF
jgi:flagellar biosynthesis protein FliR